MSSLLCHLRLRRKSPVESVDFIAASDTYSIASSECFALRYQASRDTEHARAFHTFVLFTMYAQYALIAFASIIIIIFFNIIHWYLVLIAKFEELKKKEKSILQS